MRIGGDYKACSNIVARFLWIFYWRLSRMLFPIVAQSGIFARKPFTAEIEKTIGRVSLNKRIGLFFLLYMPKGLFFYLNRLNHLIRFIATHFCREKLV